MTLFGLPHGERLTLISRQVGVEAGDASLWVDRVVRVQATATPDVKVMGGVWRRRFTDCEPPVTDYSPDVWVAEDVVVNYAAGTGTFATASR